MNFQDLLVFLSLMMVLVAGSTIAAPSPEENPVNSEPEPPRIIAYTSDIQPAEHTYFYQYETENKIKAEEHGILKDPETQSVEGSYSYVGADGQTYSVRYIADENGFRAEGDHLPKGPPVPEAIRKSLEQLPATEEPQDPTS